jgi:hypothetical protein
MLDCQTHQIKPAPENCSYLTLSYVWGGENALADATDLPRTIADAVYVTMKLGYRYLWVDKYCIDQRDVQD